jgi:hypothetical protein
VGEGAAIHVPEAADADAAVNGGEAREAAKSILWMSKMTLAVELKP